MTAQETGYGGHYGGNPWGELEDGLARRQRPYRIRGEWRDSWLFPGTEWQRDAACLDSPLDFTEIDPDQPGRRNPRHVEARRRVCRFCPVADLCFDLGVEVFDDLPTLAQWAATGIWGGYTGQEIQDLLRQDRQFRKVNV